MHSCCFDLPRSVPPCLSSLPILTLTSNPTPQDADKLLVMQLAIKCADVSHPARAFRFHARWSSLIAQEFYAQGDMERGMVTLTRTSLELLCVC